MKKNFILVLIISTITLGGCVSALDSILVGGSPADVLKRAEKAHDEIENVEVVFVESVYGSEDEGVMKLDLVNDRNLISIDELDFSIYMDIDEVLFQHPDGEVEPYPDSFMIHDLEKKFQYNRNPIAYIRDVNESLLDHFSMEKENEHFILAYDGTVELLQSSESGFAFGEYIHAEEYDDLTIQSFDLTFTINQSTYLIEKMEQNIEFVFEEDTETVTISLVHSFKNYNDSGEIEKLVATIESTDENDRLEQTDTIEGITLDEMSQYEEEASAYLDALIQATVFQDADAFVERAPDSMKGSSVEREAKIQKDFFKDMYIENTKLNMMGTNVTDEQIEDLADAFLEALAKTKYEMTDAMMIDGETILVTVSVEGIDDTKVYTDTDNQVYEAIANGEVTEENVISKNIEMLIENYKDASLLEPKEVFVHVSRQENGDYFVLLQDEYLVGGFVQ